MKKPTYAKPKAWLHSLVTRWLTLFANIFADVQVRGLENLPPKGGVVVVANHRSYFDAIALTTALGKSKRDAMVLAKSELFSSPLKSRLLRQVGAIPVYRNTASAVESLQEAITALQHGEMVVLFPEGHIPQGQELAEFKTGAARMALEADVPVIVIAMVGTDHVIARNLKKVKRRLTRSAFKPATIRIDVSAPLYFSQAGRDRETVVDVTDMLHTKMRLMLENLEDEMENIKMGKKEVGLLMLLATPVLGRAVNRVWKAKKSKKK